MSDALGQDQFQPVVNRRAGYGDALEMALSAARKGWTLSAGQGLLIVEHYEEKLAAAIEKLAATIGERERFMHRMYEARVVTDAMIAKGWSLLQTRCLEDSPNHLDFVSYDDFADALTAALSETTP